MKQAGRNALLVLAVAGWTQAAAAEEMTAIGGPIDLRPVATPAASGATVRKQAVRLAPPLPRPRPGDAAPADTAAMPPAIATTMPEDAAVDRTVETGAIAPAEAEPAPVAGRPAPPVVTVAAVAQPVAEAENVPSDDLPGGEPPGAATAPADEEIPLAAGEALSGEPYQLVRTLQMLQDQIAQGSTQALAAQRRLRAQIDVQFAGTPVATWQDGRNAAAAVTYVLSGGSPAILEKLVALDPPPAVDKRLLGGVLAYITGHEALANELLGTINPFDLPAGMAAQVALAQSALAVRADPAKAMQLLDTARLLGTGTLVEEAALRREIFVADQLRRYDKVAMLARQYLERFRHSVYAGNFRNRFAAAVTHMDFVKDEGQFTRLDDMVANIEPPARCQLYLSVALASLVRGNAFAARLAAERAATLAEDGSVEASRAALYRAAGGIADARTFDAAVSELADVQSAQFSESDQALRAMVQATMEGVASGTRVLARGDRQLAWLAGGKDETAAPIVKRANQALAEVDAMLAAAP